MLTTKLRYKIILFLAIFFFGLYLLYYYPHFINLQIGKRFWWYSFSLNSLGKVATALILITTFLFFNVLNSSKEANWQSKGIYTAFIISLFAEMFGFVLLVYLLSPFIDYPVLMTSYQSHPIRSLQLFSIALIITGISLIIIGWRKIYNRKGLVTTGVYRFIRHPQYAGFMLICIGWVGYWPTLITFILLPFCIYFYAKQAFKEDQWMQKKHPKAFETYKKTPMFIPYKLRS